MHTTALRCLATLACTHLALAFNADAQCPNYSDGVAEAGIGSVTGGTYVPMVYVDCLASIYSIEVQFGRPGSAVPINGDPLTLAVWDDPTDDMDPHDAVLVATIPIPAGITGGHTGQWVYYNVVTLTGNAIPCTGGMFIGAAVSYPASSGHGPAAIDFSNFTLGTQWFGGRYPSNPGPFDFSNLNANSFLAGVQNQGFPSGNWLLRASGFERSAHACGTAGISCIGSGLTGTNVVTTVLNPQGFPFVGYGLTALAVPFCNCTVAHDWTLAVGGASHTLPLPASSVYIGLQLFVQGMDFLAAGGCPSPQFTLTDSFAFSIH